MNPALAACAVALSLGCYTYAPASLDVVPAGAPLRALLSTEAQVALHDSLGLEQRSVQGTLVERDGDRVLLAVQSDRSALRAGSPALYQRIALAPRDLLRVEVKRIAPGRTAGLLGVLAAAATLLVVEAIRHGNPGTPQGGGGGPPE